VEAKLRGVKPTDRLPQSSAEKADAWSVIPVAQFVFMAWCDLTSQFMNIENIDETANSL
jgi:hypothetical protein